MLYKTSASAPLSGSQGGVVFAPIAGRGVARAGSNRIDPATAAQWAARAHFYEAATAWRNLLSNGNRTNWADAAALASNQGWGGVGVDPYGFLLFRQVRMIRRAAGLPLFIGVRSAHVTAPMAITSVSLTPGGFIRIDWVGDANASRSAVAWRIRVPDPRPGRTRLRPREVLAHTVFVPTGIGWSDTEFIEPPIPLATGDVIRLSFYAVLSDHRRAFQSPTDFPL